MKKQPNIVVVGSSNTDMIVKSMRIPKPGETVIGGEFSCVAGGKGANQAVAAARLGGNVTFIAKLGNDVFGETALNGYRQERINTDWIVRDPTHATGVALILVDNHGENLISVASGANLFLSPDDVARAESVFVEADVVVSQLETPLETLLFTAELATKHGIPMILDPAPSQPLPPELLTKLFCIKPNENEAAQLTGIEVVDLATSKQAADALLRMGAKSAIITLGTKGAFVYGNICENKIEAVIPAYPVNAIDSTAAGDAFSGALAVGLGSGLSLLDAAQLGSKAAAISVTRLGAQPSLPTEEEIRKFESNVVIPR